MLHYARNMLGRVAAAAGITRKSGGTLNGTTGTTGTEAISVSGLGLVNGDTLVIAFAFGDVVTDRVFTCTGNNSGAAAIVCDLYANDTADCNLCVAILKQGATPDTTVSFGGLPTSAQTYAIAYTIWGGVNATSQDVAATTATGIDTNMPNPPSITPTTAGAKIVNVYAATRTTQSAWNTPGDVSDFIQSAAGGAGKGRIAMANKDWTSGAFDAAALTGGTDATTDAWCACSLALRP